MSAVDGTWEVTVTSPMGQQKITMELALERCANEPDLRRLIGGGSI